MNQAAQAQISQKGGLWRADVLTSVLLHLTVVALLAYWTPKVAPRVLLDTHLPIDIVTIDEFTRLLDKPKPQETVEQTPPPAPQRAAPEQAPPPPALEQDAMPTLTQAEKSPVEKPEKQVTQAPVFKVSRASPIARPVLPAPKPKPLLDIGQVRALLDKTPDAVAADTPRPQTETEAPVAAKLTLNEIDAFRAQMRKCWSPPAGARRAEDLVVNVRLSLSPNGAILAGPVVVNRSQLGDPFFRAAAESVLRAIHRCQPFDMPIEKYASWRDIELTFDPRKMLGS